LFFDWISRVVFVFSLHSPTFSPVCKSVVAILLLELTGIPQLSQDRAFGWPKPSFIIPSRSHTFEVSVLGCRPSDR
jgi:hypothetical protein